MKPKSPTLALALLALTSACSGLGFPVAPAAQVGAPLVLITAAPNASATPTAFQPPYVEQATPTSLYSIQVPTLEPFLPTATASATPIPPIEPTATVDLNSLFPTAAAPPLPSAGGDAPAASTLLTDAETVNFLLIGSDKRPGGSYRTDTMVVVVLWPRQAQVSMISIPRDLWIYIPSVGMQRINTAYQSGELYGYTGGGPGLLRDTIAYNLGIRIDHTAMVEFDGFRRIVDTLGGVDVPVACPYTDWRLIDPSYDPYNEDNWALYTVDSGVRHMDGDLALWYARSRMKSNDFDRGRRQQEVLRALFAQALRSGTLSRVPQLYTDLSQTVVTDLGLGDLLKLALFAPSLTNASIRSYYIRPPYVTSWMTPAGAAVLLPDQAALEDLMRQATSLSSTAVQRQATRIEVENGTTVAGLDGLAANRLNYAGYAAHIAAADRQDYGNSSVIDMTALQDPSALASILQILDLTSATVTAAPDPTAGSDYRVILGYDYKSCFQPEDLAH
ncbi:MAG TPA: LCP family protein [Anaerolineales bacterium]|nr:LCP family protein [Anaerolineales bacterium]